MDAHQINPKKAGRAQCAFALAVTPPKGEAAAAGRRGRKDTRALGFMQRAAAATVNSFKPAGGRP